MSGHPCLVELARTDVSGRTIELRALRISRVYEGLLEGIPDPDEQLRQLVGDRAGRQGFLVIEGARVPTVAGRPDRLPRFAFDLALESPEPRVGSDAHFSRLDVLWLDDEPGRTPGDVVAAVKERLAWDEHAADAWW